MRTLALGDLHGCYDALAAIVEVARISPDDLLITLGDYVDRGPDSCAVLDWLLRRWQQGNLIPLRGNHDIMMLRAREDDAAMKDWLQNGGDTTLASYAPFDGDPGQLVDVPDEHWRFIEQDCRAYYETASHLFVHASAYADLPLAEQPDFMLYWEKIGSQPAHESGKTLKCDLSSQKSGQPLNLGHSVCIDTWVYGGGWLTCLDVDSRRYWQTNQQGQSRSGYLDDCD